MHRRALVGSGLALVVNRRQRSVKLAFNLAQFSLTSVVSRLRSSRRSVRPAGRSGRSLWAAVLAGRPGREPHRRPQRQRRDLAGRGDAAVPAHARDDEDRDRRLADQREPRADGPDRRCGRTRNRSGCSRCRRHGRPGLSRLHLGAPAARGIEMLYESTRILQRSPQLDSALRVAARPCPQDVPGRRRRDPLLPSHEGDEVLRCQVGPGDRVGAMQPVGPTLDDPLLIRAVDRTPGPARRPRRGRGIRTHDAGRDAPQGAGRAADSASRRWSGTLVVVGPAQRHQHVRARGPASCSRRSPTTPRSRSRTASSSSRSSSSAGSRRSSTTRPCTTR